MKLVPPTTPGLAPKGPTFGCGGKATRVPHANVGGATIRVPSHIVVFTRFNTQSVNVFGSRTVALGNKYGRSPNPDRFRLPADVTLSPVRQKFGSPPVMEHPS